MPRKLHDSVVVITGASSGIGRAAALEFARRGAAVVVAARREEPLRELAAECQRMGAQALAVPTDVTDEAAVQRLARRAVESFGRLDVWVNNAAVSLFARFEEAPPDAFRRVIETNLFGYVYGARAALPYFREQGSGVLINNSSIVAYAGQPYTSAYTMTKAAIVSLSKCLREESRDAEDIHVCTVLPATFDTPLFQHAGNYTGRAVKPMSPIYDAEKAARTIVSLASHPRREVVVGNSGRLLALSNALAPGLTERVIARMVERDHFQDMQPADPTPGNLFRPMPQWTGVSGNWKSRAPAPIGRVATVGLAALVPALIGWFLLGPGTGMLRR